MNDPHVVVLLYRIEHDNTVKYDEALPIEHEEAAFRIKVADKQVRIELKEYYNTEDAALTAVGPYIRSWELGAALHGRPSQFRLKFQRSEIIDRNQPPADPREVRLSALPLTAQATLSQPTFAMTKEYPPLPSELALDPDDPDVLTMHNRYKGYLEEKELLGSMV